MKHFEIELNDKVVTFRLQSSGCIEIEKKYNVKLLDYIQDYSITTIVNLLMYLRRAEVPMFTQNQAMSLFDELVDAGYTLESIMYDIIFEALVISGFMKKEDLEEMRVARETKKEQLKQDLLK